MAGGEDIAAVRKVVASTSILPDAAKQVFLDGLPGSIVGTSGKLLEAALEDASLSAAAGLCDASSALEAAEADATTAGMALEQAEAAAETAAAEFQKAVAAHAAAAGLAKESEKSHKAAETRSAHQVKEWAALREARSCAKSIIEGSLRLLVDGGWAEAEVMEASVAAVKRHLEKSHVDKVLIAGAAPSLGIHPDRRAPFDTIVVDGVNKTLNEELASLEGKVSAVEPLEKITRSEILGLWAIADCARADAAAAVACEVQAKAGQKRTHDEVSKAKKTLQRHRESVGNLSATKTARDDNVKDIEDAVSAAKRLKTAQAEAARPVVEEPVHDREQTDVVEGVAAGSVV